MRKSKIICFELFFTLFFISMVNSSYAIEIITETQKSLAIESIKGYKGVIDAAIIQKGKKVTLVIIVEYRISKSYAKELGDNFLRLVKTFSKDTSPTKEIGKGIYDYLVGVYTPDQKQIVMGAKVDFARKITW